MMGTTSCPNCGTAAPPGAAFCDNCGTPLSGTPESPQASGSAGGTRCPTCQAEAVPGQAFCDNCGADLSQVAPTQIVSHTPPDATPGPSAPAGGDATCPSCGMQTPPGAAFCDNCGTALSSAGPGDAGGQTWSPPPQQQPPPPSPPQQPPSYSPPQQPPLSVAPRLVIQGKNATLPFPQGKNEVIIGREDPVSNHFPDVDLSPHGGDEGGVSRRHAKVMVQGAQCFIEDLNSVNYTFVNKEKLQPGSRRQLKDGDEVRFGRVVTTFYSS